MPLITRISRLFRSDMHAVLDRIEDPEQLLRQAVREMDDDLLQDESRAKLLNRELQGIDPHRQELDKQYGRLDTELDLCFQSGKHELARTLVKRKLETERLCKALDQHRLQLEQESAALATRMQHNHSRLTSMKQKLEILVDTSNLTWLRTDTTGRFQPRAARISDAEVEIAFLQEQQQRAGS